MVTDYHIDDPTLDREDFTLSDVQTITSFRRSDLHNHIKRGILKYLGNGGAGRKREFSVVGLYDSGVVEALARAGLTLVEAAQILHRALDLARVSALLALRRDGCTNEQAENAIQEQPKRLLRDAWCPEARFRDLASPYLWVFLLNETRGAMLAVARGWPEVPSEARFLIRRTYPGYTVRKPPSSSRKHPYGRRCEYSCRSCESPPTLEAQRPPVESFAVPVMRQ